jgi:clan AA aspartic protease (TIGR02281 family)
LGFLSCRAAAIAAFDQPAPAQQIAAALPIVPRMITFRADVNGQFFVPVQLNDVAYRCLVDTGASDIALSKSDAARLGFDPHALVFHRIYSTFGAAVRGAPVLLQRVAIGPWVFRDVEASFGDIAHHEEPVLGMSLLRRMQISLEGGSLTLRCAGSATSWGS